MNLSLPSHLGQRIESIPYTRRSSWAHDARREGGPLSPGAPSQIAAERRLSVSGTGGTTSARSGDADDNTPK